jgi:hypothetical protein
VLRRLNAAVDTGQRWSVVKDAVVIAVMIVWLIAAGRVVFFHEGKVFPLLAGSALGALLATHGLHRLRNPGWRNETSWASRWYFVLLVDPPLLSKAARDHRPDREWLRGVAALITGSSLAIIAFGAAVWLMR